MKIHYNSEIIQEEIAYSGHMRRLRHTDCGGYVRSKLVFQPTLRASRTVSRRRILDVPWYISYYTNGKFSLVHSEGMLVECQKCGATGVRRVD